MTRQYFISTLFDNGDGLTLDQIEAIEKGLKDTIPDGMVENMLSSNMSLDEANQVAMEQARDVFMDGMRDCKDFLELRRYIDKAICNTRLNVKDMQVFRLWYVGED